MLLAQYWLEGAKWTAQLTVSATVALAELLVRPLTGATRRRETPPVSLTLAEVVLTMLYLNHHDAQQFLLADVAWLPILLGELMQHHILPLIAHDTVLHDAAADPVWVRIASVVADMMRDGEYDDHPWVSSWRSFIIHRVGNGEVLLIPGGHLARVLCATLGGGRQSFDDGSVLVDVVPTEALPSHGPVPKATLRFVPALPTDAPSCLTTVTKVLGNDDVEYLRLLFQADVHGMLRLAFADLNSVLHYAACIGSLRCIAFLQQYPDLVHRPNAKGETPLDVALNAGEIAAATVLHQCGAHCCGGWTLLHLAARDGHTERLVELLAMRDTANDDVAVQLNAVDANRRTALHLAVRGGHVECAQILLSAHGIDINVADLSGVLALQTPPLSIRRKQRQLMTAWLQQVAAPSI